MRDAAVGFQCPSCVAEGAKSTRSGRTAYGGAVVRRPGLVTNILLGINAVVWVAIMASGGNRSPLTQILALQNDGSCHVSDDLGRWWPQIHSAAACDAVGGSWFPGFADGALWQPLTSMFTHVEIWHIAMNMYALFLLGPVLENLLGRWRFAALYLLSGLAGSALVLMFGRGALGASGAIFGLMAAMLVVALKTRGNLSGILQVVVINGVISVLGASFISWEGHLGGFLGGLAAGAALIYAPRERRTQWQVLALVAVGALVAVLLALSLS
ncbi:MAG: rhomboid family intramembrane serine protease [Nocardioidaceae bacterium]